MTEPARLPPPYGWVRLDETDSTNEEARRRAEAGEQGPLWITARRQSAGRGRRGRAWDTGAANFAGTLLIRPARPAGEAAQLSFVAALAVAQALEDAGVPGVALKWPNDVLAGGAKISGILLESASSSTGSLDWLAVGIGVNLASAPDGLPYRATSVAAETGAAPAPDMFLARLAVAWARAYEAWSREGFAPIRLGWLSRAAHLGGHVHAKAGSREIDGKFIDLDEAGGLVVETQAGHHVISSGEVFFGPRG